MLRRTYSEMFSLSVLILCLLPGSLLSNPCDPENIPIDILGLQRKLKENVFGQPLASEVVHILNGYKYALETGTAKALTMSFHGLGGTGKNYVSTFIAEALFKEGLESPLVKTYIAHDDFPNKDEVESYKQKLKTEIRDVVKQCGVALIIFDEVHDMPAGVLDVLTPYMDYHHQVNGVDYRKTIFIFLSNIGGHEVASHFYYLNIDRKHAEFRDFNNILRESFDYALGEEDKGFHLIKAHLIDHFIPFLPLEEEHIEKCIITEFKKLGVYNVPDHIIDDIFNSMKYYEEVPTDIFFESGCKKIRNQVAFHKAKLTNDEL